MQISSVSFWETHNFIFLIAMVIFPRLTMLIATSFGGGFLYWLGWVLAPRFTAAIIATLLYYQTNPLLLVFVWLIAIATDIGEKQVITLKTARR